MFRVKEDIRLSAFDNFLVEGYDVCHCLSAFLIVQRRARADAGTAALVGREAGAGPVRHIGQPERIERDKVELVAADRNHVALAEQIRSASDPADLMIREIGRLLWATVCLCPQ